MVTTNKHNQVITIANESVCFLVWFVVRCFSGEYLSIFMLVDTSVLALDHFFDLFSNIFVKRRPSKLSKLSLTVHMIQSMLILMHTLEILSWNFANVPGPIVAWITINSVLLFSLLPSKFRQSRSKKVRIFLFIKYFMRHET